MQTASEKLSVFLNFPAFFAKHCHWLPAFENVNKAGKSQFSHPLHLVCFSRQKSQCKWPVPWNWRKWTKALRSGYPAYWSAAWSKRQTRLWLMLMFMRDVPDLRWTRHDYRLAQITTHDVVCKVLARIHTSQITMLWNGLTKAGFTFAFWSSAFSAQPAMEYGSIIIEWKAR